MPEGSGHVIMLYPFWGDIPLPDSDPDKGRFDDYMREGAKIFEMVNAIKECTVAILPFEYDPAKQELVKEISAEAKKEGKKLVIFFNSDSVEEIKVENAIILRTSFFKSRQKSNEFAFPGWSNDFKKYVSLIQPIQKQLQPEISYCGYVDALEEPKQSLTGKIRSFIKGSSKEDADHGRRIRGRIVRKIRSDKKIKTNFIIRDGFWAQGINDKHKVRKEYAENMFASPYALVTRGAGNFSYRLIEVMSCGRIPVFVNTDAVLPMENKINWKEQMVWIEERDLDKINDIVSDFHNKISDNDFMNLQAKNRELYEAYLSPVGFFSNFNALVK